MINAHSVCPEGKKAGEEYLDALGTEKEKEKTEFLVKEIQLDILPIDAIIEFASSEAGKKIFGEQGANKTLEQAKKVKAEGGKYCFCPVCTAAKKIIDNKDLIL